eukprot:TRINITY_DN2284_c0_g1_i1.p1 TRINITY_DN2284_c0_g1~~TRINITY_DN2284_c0_g1_i1.p1  ORF type:complete len:224 (-),score=88.81 TRINITY_DN2284_c0_g1_i1:130-801(-)
MGWDDSESDEEVAAPVVLTAKKKTSWEDDDSSEDEAPQPVASKPKNENKKVVSKAKSKKDLMKKLQANASQEVDLDPAMAKLELQRLVEEGDLELTEDLFGVAEEEGPGGVTNPKTKTEFEAYGTIIGKKVAGHFEAVHYGTMLKALLREAFLESSSTMAKEIGSFCNAQSSEKAKKEKEEAQKGKKKKTKVTLQKDHGDFMDAGLGHGGGYADAGFDDGDFM